ncbi:hypothetical protein ACWGRF_22935 [Streptomyces zhihengii]
MLHAVAFTIPSLPSANAVSVREVFELPVKNVPLRVVLAMVVFFVLGHFGAYTFVRPYLEDSTSASVGFITVVLIVPASAARAATSSAARPSTRACGAASSWAA